MNKDKKKAIKEVLEKNFSIRDKAKFFLIKRLKPFSNSLIIKTQANLDQKKIDQIELILQKKVNDPTIELLLSLFLSLSLSL